MCVSQLAVVFLTTICLGKSTPQVAKNDTTEAVLAKADLYSVKCTEDSDCILNANCYLTRCTCNTGYIPFRKEKKDPIKCIKRAAGIDDYCEEDIQCQETLGTHSLCNKTETGNIVGKCTCSENSHYTANLCYLSAYIGQPCRVNDNCIIQSRDVKTYCEFGHCICPPHYHGVDAGKDCVRTSELGGPCLTSDSCITLNSECKAHFCTCQDNFINNSDNTSCLRAARRVGDPCDEDRQCLVHVKHSICDLSEAVCRCHEGHHEVEGTCYRTVDLLHPCHNSYECRHGRHHIHGVKCVDNICQCIEGYYMEDRKYCLRNETISDKTTGSGSLNQISVYVFILVLAFNLNEKLELI